MTIMRKVIVLARHGDTPIVNGERQDAITDQSMQRVYRDTRASFNGFVREYGLLPSNAFLWHSDKKRTLDTGKAIIAGAFRLLPIPRSQDQIDSLPLPGLHIQEKPELGYQGTKYNVDAILRDMDGYLVDWFAHPDATTYEGVEITPYSDVLRAGRSILTEAIGTAINMDKGLGVLVTHGSIVEALTIAAVNSARLNPVEGFNEIGGLFEREEFATLTIDQRGKSGSYNANLERGRKTCRVDVSRL